jgi:hypothetical protein
MFPTLTRQPRALQRSSAALSILAALALFGVSCTPSLPTEPSFAALPRTLRIHYQQGGTRLIGGTGQLDAYVVDADGIYTNVSSQATWTSSEPQVLRGAGRSFSGPAGRYEVYSTYDGLTAVLPVEIRPAQAPPFLEISLTGTLRNVQLRPPSGNSTNVNGSVLWSSSDDQIATVDERGYLVHHKPGNVRITATREGLSDWYWIAVPPRAR